MCEFSDYNLISWTVFHWKILLQRWHNLVIMMDAGFELWAFSCTQSYWLMASPKGSTLNVNIINLASSVPARKLKTALQFLVFHMETTDDKTWINFINLRVSTIKYQTQSFKNVYWWKVWALEDYDLLCKSVWQSLLNHFRIFQL